ncbi:hypothetical protein QAD02_013201 [Eretmocerus hayati]|uniref:Uncharacterized protein n=1 Tax=Eretmocerus hayati TaxID=131215 RepID=A0ACC2P276_9HYME|nr:hypothetical protein QAD02_013201 [Eretmocerus hayati]
MVKTLVNLPYQSGESSSFSENGSSSITFVSDLPENDSDSSSEIKNDMDRESEHENDGELISVSHCPSQSSSTEDLRSTTHSLQECRTSEKFSDSEKEAGFEILCPLCQDCFKQRSFLEEHVMQIHSVNADGLQRLLLLVNQSHWLNTNSVRKIASISVPDVPETLLAGISSDKNCEQIEVDGGDAIHRCEVCFKVYHTSEDLQHHSIESHPAMTPNSAVSEKHVYKYRCGQCSLAFKTVEKLQRHSQYHAIRDSTKCSVCCRSFRSIQSLRRHLETAHDGTETIRDDIQKEFSADDIHIPQPVVADESYNPDVLMDDHSSEDLEKVSGNDHGNHYLPASGRSYQVLEDYLNSQSMAEDHYNDLNRRFRCHKCKVAFTKQFYLSSHNKSLLHRKGEKLSYSLEKYLDPNRPYKCDICKESFTQKNILLVHYNSVSHLHKLKKAMQEHGDCNMQTNSASTVSSVETPGKQSDQDKKPFRCDLCQVAYSQSSTLEIHKKSVLHQTRISRIHELDIDNHSDSPNFSFDVPSSGASTPSSTTNVDGNNQVFPCAKFLTSVSYQEEPLIHQTHCTLGETYAFFHQLATAHDSADPSPLTPLPSSSSLETRENCLQYAGSTSTPVGVQYYSRHKTSQMYAHLLESFGFDLVMQFNETHQKRCRDREEDIVSDDITPKEATVKLGEIDDLDRKVEPRLKEQVLSLNRFDVQSVPEIKRSTCQQCKEDFSSVWVLKAHCEEVHKDLVPQEFLEKYAQQFKSEYEKKIVIVTAATSSSTATKPITTSSSSLQSQDVNSRDAENEDGRGSDNKMIKVPEATSTTPNCIPLSPQSLESGNGTAVIVGPSDRKGKDMPERQRNRSTMEQHMSEVHAAFNAMAVTQLQQLQQYPSLMMGMMSLPLGMNVPALAAMNLQPPLIPVLLPSPSFDGNNSTLTDLATPSDLLAQHHLTLQQHLVSF